MVEIERGDILRSNDPRDGHRGDLVVADFKAGPRCTLVRVRGVKPTWISISRIFDDGKSRRYGYRVVKRAAE